MTIVFKYTVFTKGGVRIDYYPNYKRWKMIYGKDWGGGWIGKPDVGPATDTTDADRYTNTHTHRYTDTETHGSLYDFEHNRHGQTHKHTQTHGHRDTRFSL